MEISLYKDLYQGYISKEKNISKEESSKILEECIKHTSKKLNIPLKSVENNLYNLTSISRFSMNISPDYNNELKKYREMVKSKKRYSTEYYYNGNYIADASLPGYTNIEKSKMSLLTLFLIDKYKYIDPNKLTDYSYIMKLHNMSLPSMDWNQKQKKYSMSLSYLDVLIIRTYTTGGFKFINDYMRTGKISTYEFNLIIEYFPQLIDNFYKSILKTSKGKITFVEKDIKEFAEFLIERLNKIILESPKVDKEFIVYRGKRKKLFRPDLKKENYISKGFTSTSTNEFITLKFSSNYRRWHFDYIEKIIIPPGSRIFWAGIHNSQDNESEIILPMDSKFKVLETCKPGELLNRIDLMDMPNPNSEGIFSYLKDLIGYHEKDSSSDKKDDSSAPPPPILGNMCLVEYIP